MGYRSFGYQPRQFQYPARRKEDLEHQLQVEICNFLDTQMLFHKLAYFAVPNALKFLSTLGSSHKIAAAYNKMRAEGFKDGVSDLVVVLKGAILRSKTRHDVFYPSTTHQSNAITIGAKRH